MKSSSSSLAVFASLLLLLGRVGGDFVSSKLTVEIPQALNKKGGYEHREALFGIPPYGGSIAQKMYWIDQDICQGDSIDSTKGYPERTDDQGNKLPWEAPYILMVDVEHCSFVQAVRNAQKAGAAAVLIADTSCLCTDFECMDANPGMFCRESEPIMADDGSGADVSIPSFLLAKHDADLIKAEAQQNRPVQVQMSWKMPQPDGRVEYDIWTHPAERVSFDFFRLFGPVAAALHDQAYFTPHFYVVNGVQAGCRNADTGNSECLNLCTNHGRYCFPDPDDDLDKGKTGADVVEEILRRLCLWKDYGQDDGVGTEFWRYVSAFDSECWGDDSRFFDDEECIAASLKQAGVEPQSVQKCMDVTGGLDDDTENSLLEAQLKAMQDENGFIIVPSVSVNQAVMRGSFTADNVLRAVCAGYAPGTEPDLCVCTQCDGDIVTCATSSPFTCVAPGTSAAAAGGVVSYRFFFTTIFLVFVGLSSLLIWYQQRTQAAMREKVRGIVADYVPLRDQDGQVAGTETGLFATDETNSTVAQAISSLTQTVGSLFASASTATPNYPQPQQHYQQPQLYPGSDEQVFDLSQGTVSSSSLIQ